MKMLDYEQGVEQERLFIAEQNKANQQTALYEVESLLPWALVVPEVVEEKYSGAGRPGWLSIYWRTSYDQAAHHEAEQIQRVKDALINHTVYNYKVTVNGNGAEFRVSARLNDGVDVQLATEAAEIRWDLKALDDAVYDKAGALEDTRELINKRFIHRQQGSRNWAYRARQAGYVELVERLAEFI